MEHKIVVFSGKYAYGNDVDVVFYTLFGMQCTCLLLI